jgi:hypothetical protein
MFLLTLCRTKISSVAVSTVLPLAVGLEADVEGAELVGSMSKLGTGPCSCRVLSALIFPNAMQHNESRLVEAVVQFVELQFLL